MFVISLFAIELCANVPDIEMIFVDGGNFIMGSENGKEDEKPLHVVILDSFYMSKYEVTQKEWQALF